MNLFDYDFNSCEVGSRLIFFDTETTGNQEDDQIIEIGSIISDINGNVVDYSDELCSTENRKLISPEAMVVHGIRNEDLEGKPPFRKSKFWRRVGSLNRKENYFIAHSLPFDMNRLKFYGFTPKTKLIDTLQCAKHLFKIEERLGKYNYSLPNYKLQTFRYILFTKEQEEFEAKRFGIDIKAHSALSDVVILKMFFNELLKRVDGKNINEKINNLSTLSSKPILVEEFNFGKYRGEKVKDILKRDRDYLLWLYKSLNRQKDSGESFNKDMLITLKELLEIK